MTDETPNLCPTCRGKGQTRETMTEMEVVDGKITTRRQGSGCPQCLGTGVIDTRLRNGNF